MAQQNAGLKEKRRAVRLEYGKIYICHFNNFSKLSTLFVFKQKGSYSFFFFKSVSVGILSIILSKSKTSSGMVCNCITLWPISQLLATSV